MVDINTISSIGCLQNHDGSICLAIDVHYQTQPIFVTISKDEFDGVGGIKGLNASKQIGANFYRKYGAGRPK